MKIRKPKDLCPNIYFIDGGWLSIHVNGNYTLDTIKSIHAWLGQVIKYLEQKK